MTITLHPAWHPIAAHFAIGITMTTSLLVIIGLIARIIGRRKYAEALTYPIHVTALLSIWALILVGASAMIDFPAAAFAASAWFRFKVTFAIISFFIYIGIYYTVMAKKSAVWTDNAALLFMVVLAIAGAFTITTLGAAGGYMSQGHSVLEGLLRFLGLPMPRT